MKEELEKLRDQCKSAEEVFFAHDYEQKMKKLIDDYRKSNYPNRLEAQQELIDNECFSLVQEIFNSIPEGDKWNKQRDLCGSLRHEIFATSITDLTELCQYTAFVKSEQFDMAIGNLRTQIELSPVIINPHLLEKVFKLKSELFRHSRYSKEKKDLIKKWAESIRSHHAKLTADREEKQIRPSKFFDKVHSQYLHGFSDGLVKILENKLRLFLLDKSPDDKKFNDFLKDYQMYGHDYFGTFNLAAPEVKIWNTQILNYLASYIRVNDPPIDIPHIESIYRGLNNLNGLFLPINVTYPLTASENLTLENVHPLSNAILKPIMDEIKDKCIALKDLSLEQKYFYEQPKKIKICQLYEGIYEQLTSIEPISAISNEEFNTLIKGINDFLETLKKNATKPYRHLHTPLSKTYTFRTCSNSSTQFTLFTSPLQDIQLNPIIDTINQKLANLRTLSKEQEIKIAIDDIHKEADAFRRLPLIEPTQIDALLNALNQQLSILVPSILNENIEKNNDTKEEEEEEEFIMAAPYVDFEKTVKPTPHPKQSVSSSFMIDTFATFSKRKHEIGMGIGTILFIAGIALITATSCGSVAAAAIGAQVASYVIASAASVGGGAAVASSSSYKFRLFGHVNKSDDTPKPPNTFSDNKP